MLASSSYDQMVKLWEVATGICRQSLQGHSGPAIVVAWSRDGGWLASGSYDATVRLWDRSSGLCRHILRGHADAVLSLTFMPNGEKLLSGSYDRTIECGSWRTGNAYALCRATQPPSLLSPGAPTGNSL